MRKNPIFYLAAFVLLCQLRPAISSDDPQFGQRIDRGKVAWDAISEASGLAASQRNKGVLWTHNDSGHGATLYAIGTNGSHLGEFHIAGVSARDWEDIAVGPGPEDGRSYLYIGNIGDNKGQHNLKFIYRIAEPAVSANQAAVDTTLYGAEIITFRYPSENHDAETLMLDPLTRDIYIVTKREENVLVYKIQYPQSTAGTITPENVTTLPIQGVVAGDISPNGEEILIKTLTRVFYWHRAVGQPLWQAFGKTPVAVHYQIEPQGEAICWDAEGSGYFTLSEELFNIPTHVYYYARLTTSVGRVPPNFDFQLEQNYPNPFNPETNIEFSLPERALVQIKLYDVRGREVGTVLNEWRNKGRHTIEFDAGSFASGVYFYKMYTHGKDRTADVKKLMVVK